ncbi:MAG: hypothetical protein H6R12_963 [Proteobacteria bacterium]|nr:hypothetical protein [Pseudomonadota bacterium]
MDLSALIERAITGLGYEFVDLETSPRGRLLRVFIDTPAAPGGVTVDDCARVSNHLTRLFEVENVDYERLEISSAGQEVQVRLRMPIDGRRNFTGTLAGVEEGRLRLQSGESSVMLDLAQIEKARLVPKYKF